MKKILSIVICMLLVLGTLPLSGAASCAHSYSSKSVPRSCISRAKTVYTCQKCGNSYFTSSSVYTKPDGFYFAVDGDRDADTLSVKVVVGNNPGLWASRLTLSYNGEALQALTASNGTVWGETASVNINHDQSYIRFYCQNSELSDNTANGTVFTATFKILDVMDNWNVELTAGKRDNVSYTNGVQIFETVNAVTLGYGEHAYDSGVVSVAPTVTSEGQMLYTYTLCPATKTEKIDKLIAYAKGDIDGDGDVTMLDLFKAKLFIKQMAIPTQLEATAADIDGDGEVTMVDSFEIKYRISKGNWRQ